MKNLLRSLALASLLFTQTAFAKEIAVLLPLTGPLTPYEQSELTKVAVDGLSARFELKHGEEVDRFVRQVFQDESKKKECDEVNCYRRIAGQYHAEKIVALRVVLVGKGSYRVTSHLYDVLSGNMSLSEKRDCVECTTQKLKALCKEMASRMTQAN